MNMESRPCIQAALLGINEIEIVQSLQHNSFTIHMFLQGSGIRQGNMTKQGD